MIFPRKKLILPCHKNGYLQSASDARKYRDRFKRNPLAKVADMFVPKPLRMSPGYPCCCWPTTTCGGSCLDDFDDIIDSDYIVTITNATDSYCTTCENINGDYVLSSMVSYKCTRSYLGDKTLGPCTGGQSVFEIAMTLALDCKYVLGALCNIPGYLENACESNICLRVDITSKTSPFIYQGAIFSYTGTPVRCTQLDDFSLALTDIILGSSSICDFESASCLLSAT